jgi:hypothetical protein
MCGKQKEYMSAKQQKYHSQHPMKMWKLYYKLGDEDFNKEYDVDISNHVLLVHR